ncbi:MAG: helix-turn-helix domain-containing protein [Vibrio sp.]
MSDLFYPDKKFTQSDIAKLLGISERQVRNLIGQGILPAAKGRDGMSPLACNHAYIAYKSQAKTTLPEPEIDQDCGDDSFWKEELKLKLEEKRENIAMKKAKRVLFEKTYGPIEMIVDALQQVASRINTRIDGLIPKLKSAWPEMPPEAIEVLEVELAAAANECADVQPDLSEYLDSNEEGYPSWVDGIEEEPAS